MTQLKPLFVALFAQQPKKPPKVEGVQEFAA